MSSDQEVPSRIGNWILEERLGAGYSGSIWRAVNPYTGQTAALKVQDVDHECPTNRYERYFYPSLQGGVGMPTLWASGVEGQFDYLVIDLLGASLDSLYRANDKRMDLRSTLCIAMQVISRLEFMHHRGILHRDIQLGNCVIGLPPNEKVIYMIDFGFSKRYIDPETRAHIPNSRAKRDFIGNYWFSSINVHCRGKVPSRRDDMEALALMLIHLLTPGGLPWTRNGIPKDDADHDRLIDEKQQARPDDLCRGLPSVFEEFLRYCRRLKFLDLPNYAFWRAEFAEAARDHGFVEPNGLVNDAFHWPPRADMLSLRDNNKIARQRRVEEPDIENILGQLAKIDLGGKKPSSAERLQQAPNVQPPREPCKPPPPAVEVIVISSDEESAPTSSSQKRGGHQLGRYSKATAIRQLADQARATVKSEDLATVLHRFIELFHINRSKVVTKEAFEFLSILSKQLEGSSVAVSGESRGSDSDDSLVKGMTHGKGAATMKILYQRLVNDQSRFSCRRLSNTIVEFTDVVRGTNGKLISKDGFAFLAEVEARLRQL